MTQGRGFTEYQSVSSVEPLRQGDVLESTAESPTAWNRHLLVITADCDFAYDKHQGRVTCIPLLSKEEYLLELQIPKIRETAESRIVAEAKRILRATANPNVSEKRLREWPQERETEEILKSLQVPEEKKAVIGGLLDGLRDLAEKRGSLTEAVDAVVRAQLKLPNAQSEEKLRQAVRSRLENTFKNPPGDALFLSAVADRYEDGYFAYLRHFEQVWQPEITLGPSRLPLSYRRLSRLEDTYTHAIAQRFALVFMAIGLPDTYEEMRELHASSLWEDVR